MFPTVKRDLHPTDLALLACFFLQDFLIRRFIVSPYIADLELLQKMQPRGSSSCVRTFAKPLHKHCTPAGFAQFPAALRTLPPRPLANLRKEIGALLDQWLEENAPCPRAGYLTTGTLTTPSPRAARAGVGHVKNRLRRTPVLCPILLFKSSKAARTGVPTTYVLAALYELEDG